MAYDKVVDSSVLDAGLKQIADAIREKGGTSDPIAFDAMAAAVAAIKSGADITQFGFTKAVFGTTVGSKSFPNGLGEIPKCVIFWCDDIWDYIAESSTPQYYVRAGMAITLSRLDGTTEVVEGFASCYTSGGSYRFNLSSPTASQPRSGLDVTFNPNTTNSGALITASTDLVRFNGEAGSGYEYTFATGATYNWGVFA